MTPGDSRDTAIVRPTARVLLLDSSNRTLLFTVHQPDDETGLPFWFPPGGGVETGETHEQAAARELLEETGLTVPLGPRLWTRKWVGEMVGRWWDVLEVYYLARCEDPVITVDRWTELELQEIKEYRWWTLPEIRAATEASTAVFVPRALPLLLPGIIAGELPLEPHWVDIDGPA